MEKISIAESRENESFVGLSKSFSVEDLPRVGHSKPSLIKSKSVHAI